MNIFARTSAFADRIERRLFRGWFDWDTWGDPVSWIHHALWALLFAGVGALLGLPFGLAALGAKIGSLVALAFYLSRETLALLEAWGSPGMFWRGRPHWTGWLVDGILDVAGPALVAWWFW